jgi:hypothetical protein
MKSLGHSLRKAFGDRALLVFVSRLLCPLVIALSGRASAPTWLQSIVGHSFLPTRRPDGMNLRRKRAALRTLFPALALTCAFSSGALAQAEDDVFYDAGTTFALSVNDLQQIVGDPMRFDVATRSGGAVYWGSLNERYAQANKREALANMHDAQAWAGENNAVTLELTKGGRILNSLNLFSVDPPGLVAMGPSDAAGLWDTASARYALGTSGVVNVFSEGATRDRPYGLATWARSERPVLTGGEAGLFDVGSVATNEGVRSSLPVYSSFDATPGLTPTRNFSVSRIYERDRNGGISGVNFVNERFFVGGRTGSSTGVLNSQSMNLEAPGYLASSRAGPGSANFLPFGEPGGSFLEAPW